MKVLAGDIGGTNSRLIIAKFENLNYEILVEENYPSNQYANLQQVISCFFSDYNIKNDISAACFAVAGPVENDKAKLTNLPWLISKDELIKQLKIPVVRLINDFTAVALGIALLNDEDTLVIQQGNESTLPVPNPDAAIIGAGTGLGVSHRVWIDGKYHIFPSETGHSGFTAVNEQQAKLLNWLLMENKHVSTEMVLSGSGIYTIYRFLRDQENYVESSTVQKAIQDADPARIITEHALEGDDELCVKTIEMFVEIYGSTAGDVALHYYPVDELYIAGGIAPRIKHILASHLFLDNFTNKGLMASNMEKINIKLILDNKIGLYGALSNLQDLSVHK